MAQVRSLSAKVAEKRITTTNNVGGPVIVLRRRDARK